jgi:hypothetical protein
MLKVGTLKEEHQIFPRRFRLLQHVVEIVEACAESSRGQRAFESVEIEAGIVLR